MPYSFFTSSRSSGLTLQGIEPANPTDCTNPENKREALALRPQEEISDLSLRGACFDQKFDNASNSRSH